MLTTPWKREGKKPKKSGGPGRWKDFGHDPKPTFPKQLRITRGTIQYTLFFTWQLQTQTLRCWHVELHVLIPPHCSSHGIWSGCSSRCRHNRYYFCCQTSWGRGTGKDLAYGCVQGLLNVFFSPSYLLAAAYASTGALKWQTRTQGKLQDNWEIKQELLIKRKEKKFPPASQSVS